MGNAFVLLRNNLFLARSSLRSQSDIQLASYRQTHETWEASKTQQRNESSECPSGGRMEDVQVFNFIGDIQPSCLDNYLLKIQIPIVRMRLDIFWRSGEVIIVTKRKVFSMETISMEFAPIARRVSRA